MAKPTRSLEGTAYHEAGHAVASILQEVRFRRVHIIPDETAGLLGCCEGTRLPKWFDQYADVTYRRRTWVENQIIILLAGGVAERKHTGRRNLVGARHDWEAAERLADIVCGSSRETETYLAWLRTRTENLVTRPGSWPGVESMARALLERRTLTHAQAEEAFEDGIQAAMRAARGTSTASRGETIGAAPAQGKRARQAAPPSPPAETPGKPASGEKPAARGKGRSRKSQEG